MTIQIFWQSFQYKEIKFICWNLPISNSLNFRAKEEEVASGEEGLQTLVERQHKELTIPQNNLPLKIRLFLAKTIKGLKERFEEYKNLSRVTRRAPSSKAGNVRELREK